MRVVAGHAGGLRLVAPAGTDVRPTSDRVREALFNALFSLGALEGALVLDLFAGSGALGIEAWSRGAAHVTFVDASPAAIAAIEANVATTSMGADATIVKADSMNYIERQTPSADLVLLDPPYPFDRWHELLDRIVADRIVIESDRSIELGSRWELDREKAYGGTVVAIARAAPHSGPTTEGDLV